MTVKELIIELNSFNMNSEVVFDSDCYGYISVTSIEDSTSKKGLSIVILDGDVLE